MILAIDPGPTFSAYAILDENLYPQEFNKLPNCEILDMIDAVANNNATYSKGAWHYAIEMIASYGMSVGKEVFETCVWIGRFTQTAIPLKAEYVYRKDVKINLCGSMKAKDANIRQALIDRFAQHDFKNGKGTKKKPDWFHGFHSDIWSSYAVGVTYYDLHIKGAHNGS